MLTTFFSKGKVTSKESLTEDETFYKNLPDDLFEVLSQHGGCTFNKGLYRVHSFQTSTKWSFIIASYFNDYQNMIYPFAFDWMGRHFCTSIKGDYIFMFDPATYEVFQLQQTIIDFHKINTEEDMDSLFSMNFFKQVLLHLNQQETKYDECLGYKVPLFLGGNDNIDNYEIWNIEVYWEICKQLYFKVKDLPEGTAINEVKIDAGKGG